MDEHVEVLARLRRLLADQRFCALATGDDVGPYASLVAFVATPDLHHLVFATGRATRKFNNLTVAGRVALLIDNRSNRSTDLREAMAATVTGPATAVAGAERETLATLLLEKHPELQTFARSEGAALVRVDVETYYVVTRFQNVLEFHVTGEGVDTEPSAGPLSARPPEPAPSPGPPPAHAPQPTWPEV